MGKPEKDHYYLEYSYNQKDWYALNGGFPIVLPYDELSVTDALETQDPNGETISVAALSSLQNKYGKPEPVCIQSVERCESDPETVQVTYTNGMKEIRNIIRSEDGIGHIQDNDYAAPIISHRADPYIYKHTDGKYYFLGSHTDAGHNLNGTYQYLYIILRCADTLEDLTDNSGRYTEKVIYEREPIGPDRVSPHPGLLKSTISRWLYGELHHNRFRPFFMADPSTLPCLHRRRSDERSLDHQGTNHN